MSNIAITGLSHPKTVRSVGAADHPIFSDWVRLQGGCLNSSAAVVMIKVAGRACAAGTKVSRIRMGD